MQNSEKQVGARIEFHYSVQENEKKWMRKETTGKNIFHGVGWEENTEISQQKEYK